jgi:hypothetical protein
VSVKLLQRAFANSKYFNQLRSRSGKLRMKKHNNCHVSKGNDIPNHPAKEQKGTKMVVHYAAFGMLWLPHESRPAAYTRPAILGLGGVVYKYRRPSLQHCFNESVYYFHAFYVHAFQLTYMLFCVVFGFSQCSSRQPNIRARKPRFCCLDIGPSNKSATAYVPYPQDVTTSNNRSFPYKQVRPPGRFSEPAGRLTSFYTCPKISSTYNATKSGLPRDQP